MKIRWSVAPLLARWLCHAPFSFHGSLLPRRTLPPHLHPLPKAVGLALARPALSTPSHIWTHSPTGKESGGVK